MRRAGVAALGVAIVLGGTPACALEFLHIAANVGGSSGGHAALRIGEAVYHFVHEAPGILRLERTEWEAFGYEYRVLQNRDIVVHRVATSPTTDALVGRAFDRRAVADRELMDTRRALAADRAFVGEPGAEVLDGWPAIDVPGLGLFVGAGEAASGEEPGLADLRSQVPWNALPERGRVREEALAEIPARVLAAGKLSVPLDDAGPPYYGIVARLADTLAADAARDVLGTARPLDDGVVRPCHLRACVLGPEERTRLEALGADLGRSVVRLLTSRRPDAGRALLVAMARRAALERTLRAGRWIVLDAFGPAAAVLPATEVTRHRGALVGLAAVADREFETARARLAEQGSGAAEGETRLAAVESAVNRLLELRAALDGGRPLRMGTGLLLPTRSRPMEIGAVPWSRETRQALAAATRARARDYETAVEGSHGYGLLTRNCVTEIAAVIDRAFADEAGSGDTDQVWTSRFGGRVGSHWPLSAIPLAAGVLMDDELPTAMRAELPSARHAAVAELAAERGWWSTYLREANTVTASRYAPRAEDSIFLLFTDDVTWPRPLYGALNVGAGLVAAAAGVVMAPLDRGRLASAGLRGVLFSLPELAFINIRKGSYDPSPFDRSDATSSLRAAAGRDPEAPRQEASSRCTVSP